MTDLGGTRRSDNLDGRFHHLRVLSNAGLIEHRSVGTRNLYLLAPGGMAIAQRWLVQIWDTALGAYAAEASQAAVASQASGRGRA